MVVKKAGKKEEVKKGKKKEGINIQNVVVSCNTHSKFPLEVLANKLESCEYAPESFPGMIYRVDSPKASTLVFTTGKIICTGIKSMAIAKKAIEKTLLDFRSVGVKVSGKLDTEIVNMVASANVGKNIELSKVIFNLENCEYEPEQFPGVVHRMEDPKVVFLIFGSGSIICTGAKSKKDIEVSVKKLKRKLNKIKALK